MNSWMTACHYGQYNLLNVKLKLINNKIQFNNNTHPNTAYKLVVFMLVMILLHYKQNLTVSYFVMSDCITNERNMFHACNEVLHIHA